MSDKFDTRRFSNVLWWNLRMICRSYGLTFAILALSPLILSAISIIGGLVFSQSFVVPGIAARCAVMYLVIMIGYVICFPKVAYGFVTEPGSGAAYTLTPASVFEKFLAMLLCTLVIVPVALGAAYFLMDVLTVIVGLSGGKPIMFLPDVIGNASEGQVYVNEVLVGYMSVWQGVLVFLLGAVFFKTNKISKTIFICVLYQIICSVLFCVIVIYSISDYEAFAQGLSDWIMDNADKFSLYLNLFLYGVMTIHTALFGGLIYWRLKTLKY